MLYSNTASMCSGTCFIKLSLLLAAVKPNLQSKSSPIFVTAAILNYAHSRSCDQLTTSNCIYLFTWNRSQALYLDEWPVVTRVEPRVLAHQRPLQFQRETITGAAMADRVGAITAPRLFPEPRRGRSIFFLTIFANRWVQVQEEGLVALARLIHYFCLMVRNLIIF